MIRVVASLNDKLCPAHEVIRRLSKGSPSDKLSKAFTQLGRVVKTEYILRYLSDGGLRDKVQRQLNKGATVINSLAGYSLQIRGNSRLVIMREL